MDYADSDEEPRSLDRFEDADLSALAAIAAANLDGFIGCNPHHAGLRGRVLLVALCQGAALHYVDGRTGVKDFDVWTFFADDPGSPVYPVRRRGGASFSGPRFARSTGRVDLLGRTLPVSPDADPAAAVAVYLSGGTTRTARCLAAKAVVGLSPPMLRGIVLWPAQSGAAKPAR